ncbi:MAG TPA: DUF885 family protein, partial [Thermomicrobiales bacterium]|nr:DUF885 family protein [Thermomicrobiales bacterium]
ARAGEAYFGDGLRMLAADRGITDSAFRTAADIAYHAFAAYRTWLEGELMQRPWDEYAAGREAFDRYLVRGHCLPPGRDAAWVEEYARQSLADARERMIAHAETIDPAQTWQQLLVRLPADHPTREAYYRTYSDIWQEAKQAAEAHDLVTWPDFPIEYVPIPPSDREAATGLYYLFYRCPPPFGRPETHRYLVTPVEPEMPLEEQEKRLRAANDATIKLNHVVHHGGLGHHVQNYNAFRASSRIGQIAGVDCASRIALFCAGTLVEGWACYATELMEEIGYLTPLEILSERQTRLRMAARAVVDCALHTGSMTLEDAATFYEEETGMPAAASRAEAVKNSLFPGAAAMYLVGTDGIWDIRRALEKEQGSKFSLKSFHDRLLSYGAIPVSLIGQLMTE